MTLREGMSFVNRIISSGENFIWTLGALISIPFGVIDVLPGLMVGGLLGHFVLRNIAKKGSLNLDLEEKFIN